MRCVGLGRGPGLALVHGRREREAVRAGSDSHGARKALFQTGIRRGWLDLAEIDRALPAGSLSPPERWLLFYSLRAAGVEIRDGQGSALDSIPGDPPRPDF
jgi:hypothetical protein